MKKDKGVIIASPSKAEEESVYNFEDGDKQQPDFPLPAVRFSTRNASSKYDFVKVKVWLGDNADHYYVLSRFLLSRMLTVTKIPNHVALKIALDLKKLLIDNSLLDVSQSDLEANLFKLMERRGYGQEYINRYKMMTRFHHQRVPLVILVCGTACVGKSTIATQLAQRLNLPNVLQTDMVYELLRTSTDAPLTSSPVWARDFSSSEELITEFCRECRIVRKGLAGDLKKAMKDGKPIIIEGMHLDPSIYLMDDENKLPSNMQPKSEESKSLKADEKDATNLEHDSVARNSDTKNSHHNPGNSKSEEVISADDLNKVSDGLKSDHIVGSVSENKCDNIQDSGAESKPPLRREKSGVPEPVIIPIVLKMAEFDHKALLEEWISTRTFSDKYPIQDKDKLASNLKTIQDYLCSFKSQGLTVANISATTFPQTLDWLHSYLLQANQENHIGFFIRGLEIIFRYNIEVSSDVPWLGSVKILKGPSVLSKVYHLLIEVVDRQLKVRLQADAIITVLVDPQQFAYGDHTKESHGCGGAIIGVISNSRTSKRSSAEGLSCCWL